MINKIYKIVNNKYSNIFKFFFFLRYIFLIFFIATSFFLSIPKFFNYQKKEGDIKEYLYKTYGVQLNKIRFIEYNIFPLPNLSISNVNFSINDSAETFSSERINIFMNFKNIYDYKKFKAKKIKISKTYVTFEIEEATDLIHYFNEFKNKIYIKDLNLTLTKSKKTITKIKNINLSNYGYNKNKISGLIFNKSFLIRLKQNIKSLDLNIDDIGIEAKIDFQNFDIGKNISGFLKATLLNNFLKFNFELKDNILKISNSNFRNNKVSFSLNSLIELAPFFSLDTKINLKELDPNFIESINLERIIVRKEFLKKINGQVDLVYIGNNYFKGFFERYQSNFQLAFGRINLNKIINFTGGKALCKGNSVLVEEFPRLNFDCEINILNKKKLFKKLSVNKKFDNNSLIFQIKGTINILNKKISFKKIKFEDNNLSNKEDLKYFKNKFETILFDETFFKIFKEDKISTFLLEIS